MCLSQIDRLYDWKKSPDTDVVATLKKQKKNTKDEFDERAKAVIVEFAQQVSCHHLIQYRPIYCSAACCTLPLHTCCLVCFSIYRV